MAPERRDALHGENVGVVTIARLVTFVDRDHWDGSQLSFSARQDAVLADGRRIVLLNDRGWSQSNLYSSGNESPMREERSSPWEGVTRERVEETAREVVGPEAAYGACTQADSDEGHWSYLSAALGEHGIEVDGAVLRALSHEVELSDRLLARFAAPPS
jgi:hypothetical protein